MPPGNNDPVMKTIVGLDERSKALRRKLVDVLAQVRRGHVGSALSLMEVVRVLFDDVLRYDAKNPLWEDRDRFVLSKGHGCLALYLLLAEKGFFPESELYTASFFESRLGGHPRYGLPGVEAATGSLGHGLSIGVGMALAGRMDRKAYRVFVAIGDGECQEGSIWEAALSASKYGLDNLTVILDRNDMQCYGPTELVGPLEPLPDKWKAFGFAVRECDGHSAEELREHLLQAPFEKGRPSLLIAHTVKGKGFVGAESNPDWHHKAKLSDADCQLLRDGLR